MKKKCIFCKNILEVRAKAEWSNIFVRNGQCPGWDAHREHCFILKFIKKVFIKKIQKFKFLFHNTNVDIVYFMANFITKIIIYLMTGWLYPVGTQFM